MLCIQNKPKVFALFTGEICQCAVVVSEFGVGTKRGQEYEGGIEMKRVWKKGLAAFCAVAMIMTVSGMGVLADDMQAEELIVTEAKVPEEADEVADSPDEEVADSVDEIIEDTFSQDTEAEVVGEGEIQVGDGVTATFDEETGAVEFYSNGGTLWKDWTDKARIYRWLIRSIRVASGTVCLPVDSDSYGGSYEYRLFSGLSDLRNLDTSGFDTSNVTSMRYMFYGCEELTNLDLSNFDTSNVTDMSNMFDGCSSLTDLDLSNFDTSNVTSMRYMFYGCSRLSALDLSDFDMSKVTDYNGFLEGLDLLSSNVIRILKTPKKNDKSVKLPFVMCDEFGNEYSELPNLSQSITLTKKPILIPVGDGVTATFNNETGAVEFYSDEGTLWRDWLDQSGLKTYKIKSIKVSSGTVYLPSDSTEIFRVGYYYGDNYWDWNYDDDWDSYFTCFEEIDLSGFDTSRVTNMSNMFSNCYDLVSLDLSGFDTSHVTDMGNMFKLCENLSSLNLNGFDTSCVTDMSGMFSGCRSLQNLDLSGFDTSRVTFMGNMFSGCRSLQKMDLSSFDTSSVKSMYRMFRECGISSLDLSSFDTSNVEYTDYMLEGCSALQLLKTPKKNEITVDLPCFMYDDAGNEYEVLPSSSESIVLTRNKPTVITDISDCEITLSATNYTYDGKEKTPTVAVKNGDTVLTSGTDYTISYADNTDAGTATVKVAGKGNYKGEKSVTFTINKADAKLAFAESEITKKTTDAAFTNTLTKTTDGTVTFASSNTKVATVNSTSGLVTIKGAGTATITATASEGQNYKAGSTTYTLKIEAPAPTVTPTPKPTVTPTPKQTVTPTPKPTAKGFYDVQDSSHPYYNAIYWAADAGITKGYSDGTFGINRSCTRGEMMMFLWRYAGKPAPKNVSKSPFKDVPKTHTFYKAILWGSQNGITKGYSDGTFGINRNVSRGECMMFLWRLKGKPAPKAVAKAPFPDVPKSHVFYNAVLWGYQKKITTGFTSGKLKGKFGVNENCSRGQIVTFLYRAK